MIIIYLSVAKGKERELSTALWEWGSTDFNQGDIVLSINDVIHMCPMANRDDAVCNYAICNVCEEKHKSNRRAKNNAPINVAISVATNFAISI